MNLIALIAFLVSMLAGTPARAGDARLAPPPDSRCAALLATLRMVHAANYALPHDQRAPLAKEFLARGDGATDATERFVLLTQARDVAAQAGDGATALAAIAALAKAFQVEAGPMRLRALESVEASVATPGRAAMVARMWLAAADLALDGEDFTTATRAIDAGRKLATRSDEKALGETLSVRRIEIAAAHELAERAGAAASKLVADPENRAAHGDLGRYLCFVRHDWAEGLAHLRLGADAELAAAAAAELGGAAEGTAAAGLADAWWQIAAKAPAGLRRTIRSHAREWYASALAGVDGITRMQVEQRLRDDAPVASTTARPMPTPPREPATDGLIGRWLFDEGTGTVAEDGSGHGNRATLQNGVAWVDGIGGRGLRFDGADDFASVALNSPLPATNAPQSIAFYFRVDSWKEVFNVIALRDDRRPGGAVQPGMRTGQVLVWKLGGDCLVAAAAPTDRAWHHFAYTYDGTTHRLFLDGDLKDHSTVPQVATQPRRLEFGRWSGKNPDWFRGDLDEVRIYSRALSSDEVKLLLRRPGR